MLALREVLLALVLLALLLFALLPLALLLFELCWMLDGRLDDELEEVFAIGRNTSWNTSQSSEPEYWPTYKTADEWHSAYEAVGEHRDRPTGADHV